MKKWIKLIVVLVLIVGLIFFFESSKPKISGGEYDSEIPLPADYVEESLERISLKEEKYSRAKELISPDGFINVDSINISSNVGKKVILIDFWTYSCINCQRTQPYLNSWFEKYEDEGLLIIGIHTPEFEFEKDYDNLLSAVLREEIKYPVVQDNNYYTWRSYKNRYWPRKYLIDIDGFIVYDHIGEGAYSKTEQKIQELLREREEVLNLSSDLDKSVSEFSSDKGISDGRTSEIYFGYDFSREQFGNDKGWVAEEIIDYEFPELISPDLFYLEGSWMNGEDHMELVGDEGRILIDYFSKSVNIVAEFPGEAKVDILLDGDLIGRYNISDANLYQLVNLNSSGRHTLEIPVKKGFKAYTFTFG